MKKAISLILALVLCLSLCACSPSKEDLVGTWSGSWTYKDNQFEETIVLKDDGTYKSAMYKNGKHHESESGTYEINGRTVELHPNGDEGCTTPYKYKGGKLVNNDHEFFKE